MITTLYSAAMAVIVLAGVSLGAGVIVVVIEFMGRLRHV